MLSRELQQAAEGKGFAVVWRAGAAGGDFVSVRNMDLERSYSMNLGNRFPMRLSLTVHRRPADQADATLMVANRTCVVWHSGERDVCRETGEAIIAACTQPVPQQR